MNIAGVFTRFPEKLKPLFLQGLTAKQLAVTIALSFILGIFPFFYVPTLLVLAAVALFRFNFVVMMTVNFLVYPLQLLLFFPLVKLGGWVFQMKPAQAVAFNPFDKPSFGFSELLANSMISFGLAIAGWLLICVPLYFCIRTLLLLILERSRQKRS